MNAANFQERPVVFECQGDRLFGIAAIPARPLATGVVIVVGGPQYRAGSHRQFTLLARHLAGENIASFRFDCRGMGDSGGEMRTFETIDADIQAAIDGFLGQVPGLSRIVLWGLCDAASASLMYGHADSRIAGLILLNPWVHSEAGAARVRLKYYYLERLKQPAFWKKLLLGKVGMLASLGDIVEAVRKLAGKPGGNTSNEASETGTGLAEPDFIARMLRGCGNFRGKILIVLSGQDATAQEFATLVQVDSAWARATNTAAVEWLRIPEANHTFASAVWRRQVATGIVDWIGKHYTPE